MRNLVKALLVSIVILLVGACASRFDENQHEYLTRITLESQRLRETCGDFEVTIKKITEIRKQSRLLSLYSARDKTLKELTRELDNLIQEMENRYRISTPSIVYCQEKSENIVIAAERILEVSWKRH